MLNSRSPPQYKQQSPGGSVGSASSASQLLGHYQSAYGQQVHSHACYQHQLQQQQQQLQPHQQKQQHHHHHGSRTSLTPTMKRGKKQWGTRERSGMSFLIVITFFAVFGLIILTEVFMIDERTHSGMLAMRAGVGGGASLGGRMGDSMPDYDNVKDDYDLLDASILSDNKLGFVQLRDNKLKIQEAAGADGQRLAGMLLNGGGGGGGAGAFGVNVPLIPWGQVLPDKVEETLPHFPFGTRPTDGAWQVVNGTRFKFFVYSAYFDRREGTRLVRVVGATKTRGPERVWCRFWYGPSPGNGTDASSTSARAKYSSATVMARVKIIRENWNLKYSACFILCPVRTPPLAVPHFVSVVSRLRAPPGNLLTLRNTDQDADFAASRAPNSSAKRGSPVGHPPPSGDNIPDRIAVCVKPLHFNYDQALYLMEYLEFYALLGVSHFTFYNHTLGPHASCVLDNYQRGLVPGNLTAHDLEPLTPAEAANNATPRVLRTQYQRPTVSILPWNLRMRSQKEIRTEGLFAALNDCLYRTMYRYKYLALVDLDEFIVPRYSDTLNELIGSLNQRFRNRNTGAYSFQNAFYYLQFADDSLASSGIEGGNDQLARVRANLVTQRKTRRRYKLHPQKQRSKYICKPEAVVEAGNHFVWEFAPGKGSLNVPPKEAILQHYRVCEFGGNDCIKAPSIVDRTTTKYVNRLVQRVDAVYRHLRQRCDLPALPPLLKTKENPQEKPLEMTKEKAKENTNDKTKEKHQEKPKENPKLLEPKRKLGATTNESLIKGVATATATTTTKATTKGTATKQQQSIPVTAPTRTTTTPKQLIPSANVRKKRKLIVFEINDLGVPVARVEYQ
ncbi:uncharacterized protein LOC6732193 isoform X1 [Drosophila simulans]|uniref:Uncharacterized protein, isoform B n=2 Tax=Drosophila simulans TaxID=7240 RepID=A0A0J9R1F0_DROSI|nr:uncharacterized protein LOC6732193 isoform X1 [Drosophila simulans]XP_039150528.1 uncharacterized protein LOC6732193 isoform X1 [Drosophila simulans]XP_039150535.1 uncharacterized protein LOC6732193 isoform X1 [Drosophila simulans]XP_044779192.1 uncharacterized protein LOC6732193 isoform X1 [Drosophila simulans]KMY90077.1 uncharacterized protein Dsimw501_GD22070, isoform B [Drosophila simulans]KMY90078.1 uncharacterized protein Dsimw501_GD22070, isoform C [Drosophila simulans]